MYKAPTRPVVTESHISTSSSVYSPIESKFEFRVSNSGNIIEEEEVEEESLGSSHERNFSFSTGESEGEGESGSELGERNRQDYNGNKDLASEPSNQTFDTYITARDISNPSFSSINDSLLRGEPNNHHHHHHGFYDSEAEYLSEAAYLNDVTPKLIQHEGDKIDDLTPIIGADGTFINQDTLEIPESTGRKSLLLPQQEMSSMFKRLSMTIQQSHMATSRDSAVFLDNFQQNIDRATVSNKGRDSRMSTYYNKIHDTSPYDERDELSELEVDTKSRVHILRDGLGKSKRLSNRKSGSGYLSANNLSESSIDSSFDTYDKPVSDTERLESYTNVRGSRISPLKVRVASSYTVDHSDEEIPIRKDLITRFESIKSNSKLQDLSDTEKEIFRIASNQQRETSDLLASHSAGLNISYTESVLDPKNKSLDASLGTESSRDIDADTSNDDIVESSTQVSTRSEPDVKEDEEDLSALFIRALHPFDSSTLQLDSDVSICLSFEKDDLAFIHTIDESGWGEVTLIESLQRGWIPMNYFVVAVQDDNSSSDSDQSEEELDNRFSNSVYLRPLFHACGKFLMNPLSHQTRNGNYTFSTKVINSIRDGVRILLQETDCLSRSNEIVTKRPIVRKIRKSLLADWYNLMVRANEFKGTSNFNKIEILTLMLYQVARKAISFLQVWSIESNQILRRENEKKLKNDMINYPLLPTPPQAKQRITEINGLLYMYLGLIIGRLDFIEHNSDGCDILETLTHQIILLLRELLFISKTGSDFSAEKPADLDDSLDTLLSLVSGLVSGVKSLVVKTLNETPEDQKNLINEKGSHSVPLKDYYYTREGGDLIQIATRMIRAISKTIGSIRKLLDVTGDFKLNAERSYPDYSKMKIEPEEFIKKCSIGIAKSKAISAKQLKSLQPPRGQGRRMNRYSMLRSGQTGNLGLNPESAGLLNEALFSENDSSFSSNPEFKQYTTDTGSKGLYRDINNEILVDSSGNLMGASFKGLVYTLTNEKSPPEYFFVSTFFICFRSFANGIDLIEELISRFEVGNKNDQQTVDIDVGEEIRLKNRRRLIVKMFQIWLESYWNHDADSSLLTTLVNFFNEGVSLYLPLESIKLLEVAAKLSSRPLVENQKSKKPKPVKQLVNRSITITRMNRKSTQSTGLTDGSLSARYSMVDGYELSKINTNSSTSSSLKSMTLPLPLGVGNQTSSSNSLLTKNQIVTVEKVNLTFRAILGESWCPTNFINSKEFIPLRLNDVLDKWYTICDQSWVLSNYRPNLLDFNGLELAKQLTLIESEIFCSIKPEELLNENYTSKRAHLKLAPNIRKSLLFTNCLSGYVLESILQPGITQKMRVNIVKTWLKIAISCLYLRNFNSLAAIVTSLQSHLVTRIIKIWDELSEKYRELYDYLSGIIHPDKNYSVYRVKLKNFLVSNDYNIPIVPYFLLFLQDLTFVTDGNPNYRTAKTFLNQKLINIDKYLKITRIIADIESLQIPYTNQNPPAPKDRRRSSLLIGISGNKPPTLDEYNIVPLVSLQELVLLELWKVCQLNRKEEDRAWKLSCLIQPRM